MNIIQLGQKDGRPKNKDKVLIELGAFSGLIRDDLTIESIIRDLRYIRNQQTSQED
jgi:hypothetical protein